MNKSLAKVINDKTSTYINIILLLTHIGLFSIFAYYDITLMMYVNIFSVLTYLICFYIIKKEYLITYIRITYCEISIHMCLATLCLGWSYGFHLYCISMITIIFYADYMSLKVDNGRVNGNCISLIIMSLYILCLFITNRFNPIYTLSPAIANIFLLSNSLIVFVFLIIYMNIFIQIIASSEKALVIQAENDKLTGLHNRYYMLNYLEKVTSMDDCESNWMAMIDIDNFKIINDTYGHNCGDYVLERLSRILEAECDDCSVCRWGGEEFIIVGHIKNNMNYQISLIDKLRQTISTTDFTYADTKLDIAVTIGVSQYSHSMSIEDWVNITDKKLYVGKYNGKNRVVS